MKSQNKKNLYRIFVNSIIRREFSKDEVNEKYLSYYEPFMLLREFLSKIGVIE